MGDASKNFSYSEFACPHCGEVDMKQHFIDRLQKVRDEYDEIMTVSSGYRCPAHNSALGASKYSVHPDGEGGDFASPANQGVVSCP